MTLNIFGLTGYAYGLAAGIAAFCYLTVVVLLRKKTQFSVDTLLIYGVLGLPLGLIVSRLFFCAANCNYFTVTIAQPGRMLAFWDGGYSMMGLLAGLVLAAFMTAKLQKVDFKALLDSAVVPMGLLLCILRAGEGFTGVLGVGRQVDVGALGARLPFLFLTEKLGTLELYRLAVFRYEAAFALIIFVLMLFFRRKPRQSGDLSMLFFSLYGAGQILLESMRDDGHMVLGFIRVQQVLALLSVLTVLAILCRCYGRLHGARDAVTAAWAMLPIAALILLLMLAPINHVLDLTGHIAVGFGILAALGLYMAFFLRFKGANPRLILTWILTLLLLFACVMLEFSMDTTGNLLRDYLLMALCCASLFLSPYTLLHSLTLQEVNPS